MKTESTFSLLDAHRPLLAAFLTVLPGCGESDSSAFTVEGSPAELVIVAESCPGCAIELEQMALLGSLSDPAGFREDIAGQECMVGRLITGDFIVSGLVGGGQMIVYSDRGEFLRTIGRMGQGPGELGQQVRLSIGPGDTIFVMDDSSGRLQVLSSDGQYVRSFLVPSSGRSFARLDTGGFVFFVPPGRDAQPILTYVSATGDEIGSFGQGSMADFRAEAWRIDSGRNGHLWAGSVWNYELEKWAPPDSVLRIRRNVSWFPPFASNEVYQGSMGNAPPRPLFAHVWEDVDNRLWVYSWIPDENWEPGIPLRPQHEWERRTFDTMVEVIDLATGTVLASRRYDGRLGQMCDSDLVFTLAHGDDLNVQLAVIQPRLVTGGS